MAVVVFNSSGGNLESALQIGKEINIRGYSTAVEGGKLCERWSHFLRQPAKVDSLMQRTDHHEDAQTVFG
jgi:hypothetical protein